MNIATRWWLNEQSQQILESGYLMKNETVDEAIHRICWSAANKYIGLGHGNKENSLRDYLYEGFKELINKGWVSFSSPIWANMGTERGLPISCFNVHIGDDMYQITHKYSEVVMQTKIGGGTSGYFGALRHRGMPITDNGTSSGAVSFMKMFDTAMDVVSQGSTRRGAFAAYLPIDHGDIEEFLQIKSIGSPIQNLFYGVCVPDYWMEEMIAEDPEGPMPKREIWAKILESRQQKGLPYIFFTDNVNNNKPQIYKDLDLSINGSNLCSEIMLPSSLEESFICCLSSMNLELYDEWKDTNAVQLAIYFLDAVLSEFIEKTEDNFYLQGARNFAVRHRALGLGVLGYHSYLQKNSIPFESFEATQFNARAFRNIKEKAEIASKELSDMLGCAPIFEEEGNTEEKRRNTTLMAVAPTTSSSAILGQSSPGIEPYKSNYFKAGLAKGNFMRKNKYLQKLLEEKGMDTDELWQIIMLNKGSVQTLDFLSDHEKAVFKTFREISPMEIISQAAQRQRWIDQAQSLNLEIPSIMPVKDVNYLYIEAWKKGVKTLYYQRSSSVSKEFITGFVTCTACEA